MSTDTATPTTTPEAPPAAKATGQAKVKPATKTTLTVPAKPAAVTAANVATIAGTAVAAAGPAGWAVAAAGAGAVGAGVIARRILRRRRGTSSSASRWSTPRLGRFRPFRSGSTGGGSTGRRTGASPTANGGRAGRPSPTASGGRVGKPSPHPRPPGTSRTPGSTPARNRPTGSRGQAPKSFAGRVARRAGAAVARGTGRAARAGGRVLRKRLWPWMRRIVRRKILHQPDPAPATAKAKPQPATPPRRQTRATVRRPVNQQARPSNTRTEGNSSMADARNGLPVPAPDGPVYAAARNVLAAASEHTPKGMLEVRNFAWASPYSIKAFADAYRLLAEASRNQPVESEWGQAVMAIATLLDSAAEAARKLGPGFDDLHFDLVRRLLNPRPGEAMWDTVNNH